MDLNLFLITLIVLVAGGGWAALSAFLLLSRRNAESDGLGVEGADKLTDLIRLLKAPEIDEDKRFTVRAHVLAEIHRRRKALPTRAQNRHLAAKRVFKRRLVS